MRNSKRSANKFKKSIMTLLISALGLAGIGGAGYVTWAALQDSPAKPQARTSYQSPVKSYSVAQGSKSGRKATASKRMKKGTSCKVVKSSKHKPSRHKLKKHVAAKQGKKAHNKSKKQRYAH